jgi:hypothetical protein
MTKFSKYSVLISLSIISACATKPRLTYVSPVAIDFTGDWVLDADLSQTVVMVPPRPSKEKKGSPSGGGKGERAGGRKGDRNRGNQNNIEDFPAKPALMSATEMQIEQGPDGMGIAYPRHPYIDVDWGTAKVRRATITSGWAPDNSLVVINDGGRQKYTEIYRLDSTATVLSITYTVNSLKGKQDFVRVFTRRNAG